MTRVTYWDERKQGYVEEALRQYKETQDATSGYNIIRYAQMGLIHVDTDVDPNSFASWYPLNNGYIFLQLAKLDKLKYKDTYQ